VGCKFAAAHHDEVLRFVWSQYNRHAQFHSYWTLLCI